MRGDNSEALAGHAAALGFGHWPQRVGGVPESFAVLFRSESNQLVSSLTHGHPEEMQVQRRAAGSVNVGDQVYSRMVMEWAT